MKDNILSLPNDVLGDISERFIRNMKRVFEVCSPLRSVI